MNRYAGLLTASEVEAITSAAFAVGVAGSLADDVRQEAALRFWRAGGGGGAVAYTLGRSCAVDMQRREFGRARRQFVPLEGDRPGCDDASSGARVREALQRLRPRDAAFAELLGACDDIEQAAQALGVSTSRVKQRKAELRRTLARFLD